ncbi:Thivi_2564 family membrane protein [Flavobacterium humi]|uniref:Uncharacterized protein n=1 Tax=Flavobacterium humi TaxID=2562683 RepID=A0A4Z0LDE4_9FLAO|nr:Thivi_2564 family membrane protein [Flavobacterium humi]TGD59873.1 hypothetical protein E4635_02785 [Flavobacterium humi]
MSIFSILLVLLVIGVLLWLVNTFIPMDKNIKRIFNIVVLVVVVIWLLKAFGLFDNLMNIKV